MPSADDDRIIRAALAVIDAMLRMSFFQSKDDGSSKPFLAFKLDSRKLDMLPAPKPLCEIFVYSPEVEGVHLRFGRIARGGIRWSDRPEDFRTEILSLVKAQQVKNAVIVPVGAKGGFYPKQLPQGGTRDQIQAAGISAYKTFVGALLDLTDNIGPDGRVIPPPHVLRHDGDDPYLVVAADKGTATFSDIANGIAEARGFWLGDAFASGGSHGYDHKKMGITARGAWEAVKRHFREMGRDIQTTPFTVVGVGDMSGDVFGNAMLLSRETKLLAAFDHRHIFIDPDARSACELGGAQAPVRSAALVLGRLRREADLEGRRRVSAHGQGDPAQRRDEVADRPAQGQGDAAGADPRAFDGACRSACSSAASAPSSRRPRRPMPMSATARTTRCASTAATSARSSSAKAPISA